MDRSVDLRIPSKKAISVDHFLDKIVAEILLRLPVKSLVKFTRVCKSWNSLFKSRTFINAYLRRSLLTQSKHENNKDGRRQLLLLKKNGPQYVNSFYSYNENIFSHASGYTELIKPPILDEIKRYFSYLSMVGTRNGLICVADNKDFQDKAGFQDEDAPTIIWNPSVSKYVILPSPNIKNNFEGAQTYFFGYDSLTNDYKVLRIVTVRSSLLGSEVYSLAKGRWTCLSYCCCN